MFTTVRESIRQGSVIFFENDKSGSQESMDLELSGSEQCIGPADKNLCLMSQFEPAPAQMEGAQGVDVDVEKIVKLGVQLSSIT